MKELFCYLPTGLPPLVIKVDPSDAYPPAPNHPFYVTAPEPPVQSYVDDEEEPPRKPNIHYEDLRSKNRENYEVTLTQKAEGTLTTPAVRERERSAPQRAGETPRPEEGWGQTLAFV